MSKVTDLKIKAEMNAAEEAFPKYEDAAYNARFQKHFDELKWLYTEVYENDWMFQELCDRMYEFYTERKDYLKELDRAREASPEWFIQNDMVGMMLYVDNFADNLQGVKEKLDYLKDCKVNYVHLIPLLETPKGRSDGGYAVANFRKVQPKLGTMDDLEKSDVKPTYVYDNIRCVLNDIKG